MSKEQFNNEAPEQLDPEGHCEQCGRSILLADLVWDKKGAARCPTCRGPVVITVDLSEEEQSALVEEEATETITFRDAGELFGESDIPPSSYYFCRSCLESFLSQDVVWDRANKPRCPACQGQLTLVKE